MYSSKERERERVRTENAGGRRSTAEKEPTPPVVSTARGTDGDTERGGGVQGQKHAAFAFLAFLERKKYCHVGKEWAGRG